MLLERYDARHPLWRKKVDGSLLRHSETPIPEWVVKMWAITTVFPGKRKSGRSQFAGRAEVPRAGLYGCRHRGQGAVGYKLWFEDALRYALADVFLMTNVRYLEGRLAKAEGHAGDVEQEIPFWEFLDIEFDAKIKTFNLRAYYLQKPTFPFLFRRMSDAPPLKRVLDELAGKLSPRIHKQDWKPRAEFETEIGATNVI
jgi:hypothetical protein